MTGCACNRLASAEERGCKEQRRGYAGPEPRAAAMQMKRAWRGPTLCAALGAAALRQQSNGMNRLVSMNMVWGLGGRNASQVDGCRESEISLLGFSFDKLAAFNPRRVDLWGVGER